MEIYLKKKRKKKKNFAIILLFNIAIKLNVEYLYLIRLSFFFLHKFLR